MTADITLRGPDDVVAALPYQLGYQPHDSVVVVSLRRRRVGLVARCDLPPDCEVDEVVASLLGPLLRDRPTAVILVGYEESAEASHPVLLALVEAVERAGLEVLDVAVVREGRRYSPICSEPCCPPGGVALRDPADVPLVAEYVAMGRSPLPSRTAVEDLVEAEESSCTGVAEAVGSRSRMPRRRRRAAAAWAEVLAPGSAAGRVDRRAVADLALGLADVPWRDGLIAWLAPSVLPSGAVDRRVAALLESSLPRWGGMGPPRRPRTPALVQPSAHGPGRALGPGLGAGAGAPARTGDTRWAGADQLGERALRAERVVREGLAAQEEQARRADREALAAERDDLLQRLLVLCRSVPDECPAEAAAVCTVAAHVAWVAGDGAVARVAVDRARRLAPGYRLAELLERLVDAGLRLPPLAEAAPRGGGLGRVG